MENRRYKILLIEDNKLDQEAFKRLVEEKKLPYKYMIAESVFEAKAILRAEKFDVVITDYRLADGTAFDILHLVVRSTPVIFITGVGNEGIATKAWKAGAYDYLIKDHNRSYFKAIPITIENAINHRRTEKKLHLLSHSIVHTNDNVYITDMEDKITFINQAFCETYGYAEDEIIGKDSGILWAEKNKSPNTANVTPNINKPWETGVLHKRKDGSEFPVSLSISSIKDEDGNDIADISIARDISEQVQTERELNTRIQLKNELTLIVSDMFKAAMDFFKDVVGGNENKASHGASSKLYGDEYLANKAIDKVTSVIHDFEKITELDADNEELKKTINNLRLAALDVQEFLSPFEVEEM